MTNRVGWPGQTPAHSRSFSVTSFSVTPGKVTVVVSVCVSTAWKILPVIARSLWSFPKCNSPDVSDSREKRNQGSLIF